MTDGLQHTEVRLAGLPLSGGCAVARVCLFNEERHIGLPVYKVRVADLDGEVERFERAVVSVANRLDNIVQRVKETVGKAESEIFLVQKTIARDTTLRDSVIGLIRGERLNAETAVARALDEYEGRLAQLDDEYIRERASDLGEVRRRVLDVLADTSPSLQCAREEHCLRGKNRIIVAGELTPSLTVDLDTRHVMGFVTEHGGANSHAAILARALGIPAVSGVRGIRDRVSCGMEIMLDGTSGDVVIHPSEKTVGLARKHAETAMKMPEPVNPVRGLEVMANISLSSDVEDAVAMKAEGIGLYRTEIELIVAGRALDEDELYERYVGVVNSMSGRRAVFRLLDLGSDKSVPFLDLPTEANPALGCRGARLLLSRTDLVETQARALARASVQGPVDVLYPMIADLDQFIRLKSIFGRSIEGLRHGRLRHGVMLEVPSACLRAGEILEEADFASLGTNDLTQYLFAVDRDNELVAEDYSRDHPALWDLVEDVVRAAGKTGKPLSVCGELGGRPRHIARLLRAGIGSVSVNARQISAVRAAAKQVCDGDATSRWRVAG